MEKSKPAQNQGDLGPSANAFLSKPSVALLYCHSIYFPYGFIICCPLLYLFIFSIFSCKFLTARIRTHNYFLFVYMLAIFVLKRKSHLMVMFLTCVLSFLFLLLLLKFKFDICNCLLIVLCQLSHLFVVQPTYQYQINLLKHSLILFPYLETIGCLPYLLN